MAKKTIALKDYLHVVEEYNAAAEITPGFLIELTSAGKVQAHSTSAGLVTPAMFATENDFEGQTISDAYEADDPVRCWIPQRGDVVYALLNGGENASVGDSLVSAGDGSLAVAGSNEDYIVGIAIEAVDNSDSAGLPDARIAIRIV